ncbi:conserved hypothetical protein [Hahella chejuensis KCTC 2396]|uniref:Sel1 repeat family protein n=1 Tax=Hahella chejuensis (strain KCTC 2396) TaxID=349521 RepID=Q2S7S1_HAHCH|nr:hypothetical protein [Hahella chejuensis]ABC33303.1 conserved hypothetical protein [Hahella chejuensis KCTC 2396]
MIRKKALFALSGGMLAVGAAVLATDSALTQGWLTAETGAVARSEVDKNAAGQSAAADTAATMDQDTLTDVAMDATAFSPSVANGATTAQSGADNNAKKADKGDDKADAENAAAEMSLEERYPKQWLEDMGYLIPPELHSYNLTTLESLATQGDTNAMVHLGERYLYFIKDNPRHPDFRKNVNYPALAKSYFGEALKRGHKHAAAILSEAYFSEDRMVEAYAWNLVAEKLGDQLSVDWFRSTDKYQTLSDAQKAQADLMAKLYEKQLKDRNQELGGESLFGEGTAAG